MPDPQSPERAVTAVALPPLAILFFIHCIRPSLPHCRSGPSRTAKTEEKDMIAQDQEALASQGNELWKKAAENPRSYEANRDFALFCMKHFVASSALLDLAEEFIGKALALDGQAEEAETFLSFLSDIYELKGDYPREYEALNILNAQAPGNLDYLRRIGNTGTLLGQARRASEH